MIHDPLCPNREVMAEFPSSVECGSCTFIARVRDDEFQARKDGFALIDIKNSGFRDGYVEALRQAIVTLQRLLGEDMTNSMNCHYCGEPTSRGGAHTTCIPTNGHPNTHVNNSITVPIQIRVSLASEDGTSISHDADDELIAAIELIAAAALKKAKSDGHLK